VVAPQLSRAGCATEYALRPRHRRFFLAKGIKALQRMTCGDDHFPPRKVGTPASFNPARPQSLPFSTRTQSFYAHCTLFLALGRCAQLDESDV
jgi:hypothetical protein